METVVVRTSLSLAGYPAGRGSGGALWETPKQLGAGSYCPFFARHDKTNLTWLRGWLRVWQIFSGRCMANMICGRSPMYCPKF